MVIGGSKIKNHKKANPQQPKAKSQPPTANPQHPIPNILRIFTKLKY